MGRGGGGGGGELGHVYHITLSQLEISPSLCNYH